MEERCQFIADWVFKQLGSPTGISNPLEIMVKFDHMMSSVDVLDMLRKVMWCTEQEFRLFCQVTLKHFSKRVDQVSVQRTS